MENMVSVIQCLLAFSGYFNGFKFLNELNTENISNPQSKYSLKQQLNGF